MKINLIIIRLYNIFEIDDVDLHICSLGPTYIIRDLLLLKSYFSENKKKLQ